MHIVWRGVLNSHWATCGKARFDSSFLFSDSEGGGGAQREKPIYMGIHKHNVTYCSNKEGLFATDKTRRMNTGSMSI